MCDRCRARYLRSPWQLLAPTSPLYLASQASSYITGHVLPVDGGMVVSNMPMPFPDLERGS